MHIAVFILINNKIIRSIRESTGAPAFTIIIMRRGFLTMYIISKSSNGMYCIKDNKGIK